MISLDLTGRGSTSSLSDIVKSLHFSSSSLSELSLRWWRRRGLKTGDETLPLLVERDLDCKLSGCTGTSGTFKKIAWWPFFRSTSLHKQTLSAPLLMIHQVAIWPSAIIYWLTQTDANFLVWLNHWFSSYYHICNTFNACIMSISQYIVNQCRLNTTLFTKLNVCQFTLHSNLPNFMLAKCTMYTIGS